jgi:hypothetical protein
MKDLWEHKPNTSEKTNILLKSSMTERDLGWIWEKLCVFLWGFVSKAISETRVTSWRKLKFWKILIY